MDIPIEIRRLFVYSGFEEFKASEKKESYYYMKK